MELLNKADFYMMPVANPDGYIYTHEEVWASKIVICANDFKADHFNK